MRSVFVALFMLATACTPAETPRADLVIDGVSILDTETGVWSSDRSIFIAEGRITAVQERGATTPENATVVPGEGRYVVPGLWDTHVHSVTNYAWHFPLMVAHGVTAVRNLHTSEPDPLGAVAAVRNAIDSGTVIPIRFIANGPIIDGDPAAVPGAIALSDPARAAIVVDSLADGGADFIKIYDHLSAPVFTALIEAAAARGLGVDGHMPFAVPARDAARAGMRTVEHLSGIVQGCSSEATAVAEDFARFANGPPLPFVEGQATYFGFLRRFANSRSESLCAEVVEAYRAGGVAATPTLVNGTSLVDPGSLVNSPDIAGVLPPDLVQEWRMMAGPGPAETFAEIMQPVVAQLPEIVRRLRDAGVPLLVGTDVGNPFLVPGQSVHRELALLVEAGLTPTEAIQAATLTPAQVFGFADSLGMAKPGFVADLVLLDADPTADIAAFRQISGVVLRGEHRDRQALDRLIAGAVAP